MSGTHNLSQCHFSVKHFRRMRRKEDGDDGGRERRGEEKEVMDEESSFPFLGRRLHHIFTWDVKYSFKFPCEFLRKTYM